MAVYILLIHNNIMFVKSRYRGERLWSKALSRNGEHVVGCVWDHFVNLGLLFGRLYIFPCDILDVSLKYDIYFEI